jgi:hypothetical protein
VPVPTPGPPVETIRYVPVSARVAGWVAQCLGSLLEHVGSLAAGWSLAWLEFLVVCPPRAAKQDIASATWGQCCYSLRLLIARCCCCCCCLSSPQVEKIVEKEKVVYKKVPVMVSAQQQTSCPAAAWVQSHALALPKAGSIARLCQQ